MASTRGGLGRGLSSLLGTIEPKEPESNDENKIEEQNKVERIVIDEREVFKAPVIPRPVPVKENEEKKEILQSKEEIHSNVGAVNLDVSRETSKKETVKINGVEFEYIDINKIEPNPDQPRTNFKEDELQELADSIKREGVIQPILVRKISDDKFQIIAGERRWQASKKAGLDSIPAQIKTINEEKALELALIENLQRSDLNPIEEAYGYKRLMERKKMTQADIAQAMSKGRSTIANALRLLELPEEAQQLLFEEKITAGHARAILSIDNKEGRLKLTEKLKTKNLSVREAESLAKLFCSKDGKQVKRQSLPSSFKSVAKDLKSRLETDVKIKSVNGKNKIEISFNDEADLERIFKQLIKD